MLIVVLLKKFAMCASMSLGFQCVIACFTVLVSLSVWPRWSFCDVALLHEGSHVPQANSLAHCPVLRGVLPQILVKKPHAPKSKQTIPGKLHQNLHTPNSLPLNYKIAVIRILQNSFANIQIVGPGGEAFFVLSNFCGCPPKASEGAKISE